MLRKAESGKEEYGYGANVTKPIPESEIEELKASLNMTDKNNEKLVNHKKEVY